MKPSYISGPSSQPLLGETIGACFDRIAAAHPDADALVSCHQSLRYSSAGLRTEVARIARGLLALGVEPGDRVGVWSPNCAEWLILQYAAAKAGVGVAERLVARNEGVCVRMGGGNSIETRANRLAEQRLARRSTDIGRLHGGAIIAP
jgi:non-ribosomal peptide synthetase component F